MLLSTAIPIVIAAMVMVIISSGIPSKPIIPKNKKSCYKIWHDAYKSKKIFLNKMKNIVEIPSITIPKVSICDLNKLCNKLLKRIKTPASLYSSLLNLILYLIPN